MNLIFKKRCTFQTPILGAIIASAIGFFSCAYFQLLPLLFVFLFLALLLLLWAHGVEVLNGFSFSLSDRKLLLILCGGFGLLGASFLSRGIRAILLGNSFFLSFYLAAVCLALAALEAVCLVRSRPLSVVRTRPSAIFWSFGPFFLIVLLAIVLNLEIFDAWIRWDSYDYFYYANRLTPDSLTNLEELRLANHAAYAVSLLYLVVDGFFGDYTMTIYAVNLATLALGTVLFQRMVRVRFPHWHPALALLATLPFAFSPFTHGLIYTVGLEWFLMLGLLIFFWADTEQIPAAQGLGMAIICFSKETGVVILFAIMATRLLFSLWLRRKEKLLHRLELPLSLTAIALALLWVVDLLTFNWMASNQSSSSSGQPFNQFAFEPIFIVDRLKSLLFSNFTWLLLLVLIIGGAVRLLRLFRHKDSSSVSPFTAQVLVATLAAFLLTLLFVTYNHIRYGAPLVLLLLILLPHALEQLRWLSLRASLCGVLAVCSLLQCYGTVDPLMLAVFSPLDKGTGNLIYTDNRIISTDASEPPSPSISVGTQYNREILHFDRALDRLLAEIDYDEDTCLIFSGEYIQQSLGYRVYSEYLILGFGYPFMEQSRYIAWDRNAQRRVLVEDDAPGNEDCPLLQICYANSNRSIKTTYLYFDRLVYIQLPFRSEDYEAKLLAGTTYETIATEKYNGWKLNAIEITDIH